MVAWGASTVNNPIDYGQSIVPAVAQSGVRAIAAGNNHVAIDIKEADRFLSTNKPNVILLDLSLPEVSGFDFLKTIKADVVNRDIPIIVISAFDNHETIQEVKRLGAIDFVPKPVNLKLLMQKIKDILSN